MALPAKSIYLQQLNHLTSGCVVYHYLVASIWLLSLQQIQILLPDLNQSMVKEI